MANHRSSILSLSKIQQLEITGDDSDSGLDSDGNYGHVNNLRRRNFQRKASCHSDANGRDAQSRRHSRPTSALSRFIMSSTPSFWTQMSGRKSVHISHFTSIVYLELC